MECERCMCGTDCVDSQKDTVDSSLAAKELKEVDSKHMEFSGRASMICKAAACQAAHVCEAQ